MQVIEALAKFDWCNGNIGALTHCYAVGTQAD